MNTNCKDCDRPNCDAEAAKAAMLADNATDDTFEAWIAADAICAAHAVNWRARCLAAEAELAKLREGLLDSIADNRQAATQSANEVLP
jgi:hypothetical protein